MRRHLLIIAAAGLATAAVPALAADPESGTVSNASPKTEWTGEAPGYGYSGFNIFFEAAGQPYRCDSPFCDTFTLEVADSNDLTITADNNAANGPGCDCVQMIVTGPDDTVHYVRTEPGKPAVIKIKAAPKGSYSVGFLTNEQQQNDATYKGSAVLAAPAPAPSGEEPQPPGSTPPPSQPGQPGQPQPAPGQPQPAAGPQITINTKSGSARRAKRGLTISLSSNQALTAVRGQLRKGRKVVARGSLASLNGAGKLKLKGKRLRKGRYTLVVTAKGANGAKAGASVPFTLKK